MAGVFISYRRGDASGYAGRLRESLDRRLGAGRVFRDTDAIQPGQDFAQVIDHRLVECGALLALIGQEWLTATNAVGQRRLGLPDDFVTIEIAAALKRSEVLVVPVLVEGTRMPTADELPQSIHALAQRQAIGLRDESWDEDVDRLASVLKKGLGLPASNDRWRAGRIAKAFRTVAVAVIALAVAAMLVSRYRAIHVDRPGTGTSGGDTPGSETTTEKPGDSRGIRLPPISEFADGPVTHTVMSASVTPRGTARLVEFRIRFANDGRYDANFWNASYRLVAGDRTIAPTGDLDDVVSSRAVKDGTVSFEVPAGVPKVGLRVESHADPAGTLPVDLTAAGCIGAPTHPAIVTVAQGDQVLVSNRSAALTLTSLTTRRFVNTLRVIFAIRLKNTDRYAQYFGTTGVRVLVDGAATAPVDGPNETVEGGSSSPPRDFVFDLPTSTEHVVLRSSLNGVDAEKPFDLAQPRSR